MSTNGMPISNYDDQEKTQIATTLQPKKALTQDYEINTNGTNWIESTYTDVLDYQEWLYDSYTARANFSAGNNYLNIKGNYYRTRYNRDADHYLIANKSWTNNQSGYQIRNSWGFYETVNTMYVLSITPYNLNTDTTINLKLNTQVAPTSYSQGITELTGIYVFTTTYKSVMNDFNNYIGMTPRQDLVVDTAQDIEDIDNNYMYSLEDKWTDLNISGDTETVYTRTIEVDLEITGNTTNYFVIYNKLFFTGTVASGTTSTGSVAWGEYWMGLTGNNDITITGTGITPTGTYEYVDIPGIMFEVLGMPFSFISQAFNLTLFPGTPYQINISNLFLALIAVFVFIMLVRLIVKMKQ